MPTNKQLRLLRFMISHCLEWGGDWPTLLQAAEAIGAHDHKSTIRMLRTLDRDGYIKLVPGTSRIKFITAKAQAELGVLVAQENIYKEIDASRLSWSEPPRIFEVSGTSRVSYGTHNKIFYGKAISGDGTSANNYELGEKT